VVWISESNRSEFKEKERPGSNAGPFCISLMSISTTISCIEVALSRDQAETRSTLPSEADIVRRGVCPVSGHDLIS
jgi:hypothetical protein